MSLKKGFWVVIIVILALNASAFPFSWKLTQNLEGYIDHKCENGFRLIEKLPIAVDFTASFSNWYCGKTLKYVFVAGEIAKGGQTIWGQNNYGNTHNCNHWHTGTFEGKADEIRACASGYGPGSYHIYIPALQKPINITRADKTITIGPASDFAFPKYFENARIIVESLNSRVKIWVDDDKNIYACQDMDEDTNCDWEQAEICTSQEADWNGVWPTKKESICCGVAPFKPTEECKYYEDLRSICGKDENGKWKWAPAAIEGQVTKLSCPIPISFLSEKDLLRVCGSTTGTTLTGTNFQTFTNKIRNYENRDYLCIADTSTIYECAGNEGPLAESNDFKAAGEYIDDEGTIYFCSPKQKEWITDLNRDEETCLATTYPGVQWTGTKCCGDPADDSTPQGNYQDRWEKDYKGKAGGCYENKFIASGEFADNEQTTINYQGEFYYCNPYIEQTTTSTTTMPGTTMTITETGACGKPMINATFTGTKHNIVCEPTGKWKFTEETQMTYIQETKWETETPEGCCREDQCWDGTRCKEIGEYYTEGEKGYRCE
ncbi:hypothetical protein KY319_02805 [Candidatus Woesearchaeota archaeon]|nr:hypothetical protein [Candidatus Woesearchaeota archaeon]